MAKDSIIISSTAQGGKKLQKTITNVNPEATNANLETFAQMFNGLSTNDYGETNRVKKQLTTEPDPAASKKIAHIDFIDEYGSRRSEGGCHKIYSIGDVAEWTIVYDGDGALYAGGSSTLTADNTKVRTPVYGNGMVYAYETANYSAAVSTFYITGE